MFKRFLVLVFSTVLSVSAFAQSDDGSASSTTENPAAGVRGQSTAPLNPEASEKKTFGVSFASETDAPATEFNYANDKDKTVDTYNYVGLSYNRDKINVFEIRQYYNYSRLGDLATSVTNSAPTLLYTHTFDGALNTDPISAQFRYAAPETQQDFANRTNGILRADVEIVWTLNPSLSLAYYFNPRQSLIPSEVTLNVNGKDKLYYAKSTLIHWGTAYYNVSDAQIYYTNLGMREDWKTRAGMQLTNEQYLLNLGANFKFLKGALTLNPELDLASDETANSNWKDAGTYAESNLTYLMTVAVAF